MRFSRFLSRRAFLGGVSGLSVLGTFLQRKLLYGGRFEGESFDGRMIDRYPAFDDARSKKVIFVAHCLINQNARCNGSAETPASVRGIPEYLLQNQIGIAQMPCPELSSLGLGREGLIYDQLSTPGSRRHLKLIAQDIAYQITQYRKHGFKVLAVLGINCSPSCGVDCHAYNGRKPGKGAFMEELTEEFNNTGLEIPLIGVADTEPEKALAEIKALDI
jgi:predicted secreted protein